MLAGVEYTGCSRTQSLREDECDAVPCAALGNGDVLLSKTSLTLGHDCAGPSTLVDLFGGALSASCVRSRISASFLGEPATPNGAGDCAISYSPISTLPACWGYPYGNASIGHYTETGNPESNNLARRSCSFENDDSTACIGHAGPVPMARHSRFLSAVSYGGAGPEPALSATTVSRPSASYLATLLTNNDYLAVRLEQELKEQCAENQRLRKLLQERDEQLSTLQEELRRLRVDHAHADALPEVLQEEGEMSSMLDNFQGARQKVVGQGRQPPFERLSLDGLAMFQCTGGDGAAPLLLTPQCPSSSVGGGPNWKDFTPLHLDTSPHGQEALPFVRSFSDDPRMAALALPVLQVPVDQLQHLSHGSGEYAAAAPTVCDGVAPAAPVAASEGNADGSAGLQALLAEERMRTDRAHAALLFSSRQAARLAQQLAEMQVHAAALYEELRDWRRACLDNHKDLAKHRRAAASAATTALGRLSE